MVPRPGLTQSFDKASTPKLCPQCNHRLRQHIGLGNPSFGGIMLCPTRGCQCYGKWTASGTAPDAVPDLPRDLIEQLREGVQPTARQERRAYRGRVWGAILIVAITTTVLLLGFLDFGTTPAPVAIPFLVAMSVVVGGAWTTAYRLIFGR